MVPGAKMKHRNPHFQASLEGLAWTALTTAVTVALLSCSAKAPSSIETLVAQEAKRVAIAGKDLKNPIPDSPEAVKAGQEHFQHHCQICHGLDGHNSGVPFANKMSPEVADLGGKNVQEYSDGQLKMIIANGIRFSGMPGWAGILDDNEIWNMVHFIRHLPAKGSAGIPDIFKEEEEEHERAEHGEETQPQKQEHKHTHQHPHAH
jgi:mono/diheme cytochrome c family protein